MERSPGRRRFLKSAAAMSAAALPASALAAKPKESHAQHAAPKRVAAAPTSQSRPYMFLSTSEAAFLDACLRATRGTPFLLRELALATAERGSQRSLVVEELTEARGQ